MKTCTAVLVSALALTVSISPSGAQSQCRDGTRATLSGTIQKIERGEPEPGAKIWLITPTAAPKGACLVKQIWGRGQPPANCSAGKGFSASGKIADAESLVLLFADTVTCK